MPDRAVYQSAKDEWGNIVSLCGPFGRASHVDVIAHIEGGLEHYYIPLDDGSGRPIEVVDGPMGKYLRANWDGSPRNNLVDLPDC